MINKKKCSEHRLQYFSISFFAAILGIAGFALAIQKAEEALQFSIKLSPYFIFASILMFAIVSTIYIIRFIKFPQEVKKEFNHPIKINFFPLISKIILIFSVIFLSINMNISKYLWIVGAILQFIFTITILSAWIQHTKFDIQHLSPAWFIPIVGSVIVPIAGIQHGFTEISWFFFSIGIVWWFLLFVIVMNRIIFHNPVPQKILPTFFILFAPPAIAFIALVKLVGEVTVFGRILFYISLFMFILILFQSNGFRKIKFYLSWWAYSFPTVAIFIATLLMYNMTKNVFFRIISEIILIFLISIMIYLTYRTIKAIKKRALCIYEE